MRQLIYADVWEAVAAAVPERPAQIRGPRTVTWRDLDRRANALARHLLDAGLTRQAKVAVFLYNAPEFLESYFASFKAGLVPFNTNYRYGCEELVYLFDNADAEAVIFHASFAEAAECARARLPRVRTWIAVAEPDHPTPPWAADYETIAARDVGHTRARWGRSPDDLLLVYTGGTTGMPKGVMWRQGDLFQGLGGGANLLLGLGALTSEREAGERARRYDDPDSLFGAARTIPAAPLMHATGQFVAFATLTGGGTIVTLPSTRFRAEQLWSEIERVQASGVVIVGMAFAMPMLEALDQNPGRWNLSSLRRIISSGTIWSAENKQGLLRHLPQLMLFDTLGSSEALGVAASTTSRESSAQTARFVVGPNTAVFTEDGRRVTPGSGDRGLLASGGFIPCGYYKDEIKTARTFRVFEGVRWSLPGDWATVEADGTITLLGRGSQVINTGGEKVFPEEVEETLKRYPGVRDAAVVGIPDPRFGERVCAVVDLDEGVTASLAELAGHVRKSLADYKVPRELVLASVVRQPNGKLDYQSLRKLAMERLG